MVGNEKQADQKGALVVCDQPGGTAATVPHRRDNDCVNPRQPSPPSAEKLALRGEPTARTLVEALAGMARHYHTHETTQLGASPVCGEHIHCGNCDTLAAARAYLSTRAPAEEALIEAGYRWANAERACQAVKTLVGPAARQAIHERQQANEDTVKAALALPVEGRAPDASHEKKLGKKGAKP